MNKKIITFTIGFAVLPFSSYAQDTVFIGDESVLQFYTTSKQSNPYCFRPDGDSCEQLVINYINSAKLNIKVSLYDWTLKSTLVALENAKQRGVMVEVIADKSAKLTTDQFPIYYNNSVRINHDKYMIIDNAIVCTGSWNWTKSAENSNSENMLCIQNYDVVTHYIMHWQFAKNKSVRKM